MDRPRWRPPRRTGRCVHRFRNRLGGGSDGHGNAPRRDRRVRRHPGCGGLGWSLRLPRARGPRRRVDSDVCVTDNASRWGSGGCRYSVSHSAAPNPVSLSVIDTRRMGSHPDAESRAQIEDLLVGDSELFGELMNTDLGQQSATPFMPAAAKLGLPATRRPKRGGRTSGSLPYLLRLP